MIHALRIGAGLALSDFSLGILYTLAISSVGVYGVLFAGWMLVCFNVPMCQAPCLSCLGLSPDGPGATIINLIRPQTVTHSSMHSLLTKLSCCQTGEDAPNFDANQPPHASPPLSTVFLTPTPNNVTTISMAFRTTSIRPPTLSRRLYFSN